MLHRRPRSLLGPNVCRPAHRRTRISPRLFCLGALLCATPASADLPGEDRALAGARLAAGFASDGSMCNDVLDLGLVFDPDGPTGPSPLGGDALTPGWCFELWAVRAGDGQEWVQGEAHAGTTLPMEWAPLEAGPGIQAVQVRGEDEALRAQWDLVLREDEGLLLFTVELEAVRALPGLSVSRIFDADLDAWVSGTYSTINHVEEDVVIASSAFDGRAIALSAAGGQGGACAWCESDALLDTTPGESEGDYQLGVFVELGDLAAGERRRLSFAYAIGERVDSAAAAARAAAAAGDLDGDGTPDPEDCAPLDPRRAPGLPEQRDGLDNDCDGEADEGEGAEPGTPREDWEQAGAAASDGAADEGADDDVIPADGTTDPGKVGAGCAASPGWPHPERYPGATAALAALLGLTAARARRRSHP